MKMLMYTHIYLKFHFQHHEKFIFTKFLTLQNIVIKSKYHLLSNNDFVVLKSVSFFLLT